MKNLIFLFLLISLCSCGGKKFKVGEYVRTDSKGNTEQGVAYDRSVDIDGDDIYLIDGQRDRVNKMNILEKNEKLDHTEYHFVDEDGNTGTMKVSRFKDEMNMVYDGEDITFSTRE